jgi:hypothetical protein
VPPSKLSLLKFVRGTAFFLLRFTIFLIYIFVFGIFFCLTVVIVVIFVISFGFFVAWFVIIVIIIIIVIGKRGAEWNHGYHGTSKSCAGETWPTKAKTTKS